MNIFKKSQAFLSLFVLLALFIPTLSFAAAPSGGYTTGATLDPDCSPGASDCTVNFNAENLSSSSTAGSVMFSNGSNLAADNTNLFWDNANNRLGIGTNSPDSTLELIGNFLVTGNITPTADNTYSLGSETKSWKDVYIGPGSLYINGQKVIEEELNNIIFSADVNQSVALRTTGTGDIELNPAGTGQLMLKGNTEISGGKTITTSDGTHILLPDGIQTDGFTIDNNAIVANDLNAGISLTPNGIGGVYVTSGNLGVGNTGPTEKLHVTGNGLFTGTLSASNLSGTNTGDQDLSNYFDTTSDTLDDITEGLSNFFFTDERAQDAVGTILTDTSEIDFTYTDATPSVTASLVAGSIDETKLDVSTNASLDLADSALQSGDDISTLTNDSGYITGISGEDHGTLTGLSGDDHTQYTLLAGRSGGQVLIGGTGASDGLELNSTSNATKGTINIGDIAYVSEVYDRVGIGVEIPEATFHIKGSSPLRTRTQTDDADGNVYNRVQNDVQSWDIGVVGSDSDNFWILDGSTSRGVFKIEPGAPANSVRLDSSGYLGIGTDAPSQKLDVNGDMRVYGSANPIFRIDEGGESTSYSQIMDETDNIMRLEKVVSSGVARMRLSPYLVDGVSDGYVELFRGTNTTGGVGLNIFKGDGTSSVNSSLGGNTHSYLNALTGYVGIGTSSPTNHLDVRSTGTTFVNIAGGGTGNARLTFSDGTTRRWNIGYVDSDGSFSFYTDVGLVNNIALQTDGTILALPSYSATVGGTNRDLFIDNTGKLGYVASSRRYKENIEDMGTRSSSIYDLRPVIFDYKNSDWGIDQYGLIAEEVEEIMPEIVSYNEDGDPETVSYDKLITPMLNEIQNLRAQNEELEARLIALEEALDVEPQQNYSPPVEPTNTGENLETTEPVDTGTPTEEGVIEEGGESETPPTGDEAGPTEQVENTSEELESTENTPVEETPAEAEEAPLEEGEASLQTVWDRNITHSTMGIISRFLASLTPRY